MASSVISHPNALLLNSGRNCLAYIVRASRPSRIYIPKYTCAAIRETVQRLGVDYQLYSINDRLEIQDDLSPARGELLLYTNYFGLKDVYSQSLGRLYGERLILDCATAYFCQPLAEGHTFYSPRKFFKLTDGGILVTNLRLGDDRPMPQMSEQTRHLMAGIDYDAAQKRRHDNFAYLHARLRDTNLLPIDAGHVTAPMAYPYLIARSHRLRRRLLEHAVPARRYWDSIFERFGRSEFEYYLTDNTIYLPVNQALDESDMQHIVGLIS